jgi:hypothetical protein
MHMLDRLPDLRRIRRLTGVILSRMCGWALRVWRDEPARERAQAIAAFACIFAFTFASIDYLITGGPDWNPGGEAYAMEAAPSRAPAPPPSIASEPPPTLATLTVAEPDYRFTSEELLGGPRSEFAFAEFDEPRDEAFNKTVSIMAAPRAVASNTAAPRALKAGR